MKLNTNQQLAFDSVSKGQNTFITGQAGTGKSYLIEEMARHLDIDITATTGIAAINIGGQTLHKWGGFKPNQYNVEKYMKYLHPNTFDAINRCRLLLIDEVSMLSGLMLEFVSECMKSVKLDYKPFGGVQTVVVGDFLQLPPVKIEEQFAFETDTWKEAGFKRIDLEKVERQDDPEFIDLLHRIRVNKLEYEDLQTLNSRKPRSGLTYNHHVKLYATNKECDQENQLRLNAITSEMKVYNANCNNLGCTEKQAMYFTNMYFANCLIQRQLFLKVGARVMMLTNTHIDKGIANGSTGTVIGFKDGFPNVLFDNGRTIPITFEEFKYREKDPHTREYKDLLTISQIPLRLSWAITIHKSQGMTLEKVYCHFGRIFAPSQAYVALSRCKSLENLVINNFATNRIKVDKKARDFMVGAEDQLSLL